MSRDLILRGGRVLCAGSTMPEALDVRIGGNGRIVAIAPDLPDGDAQVCVLDGQLVLPGLVDIHQHLDKSRTRALVSNPSGTLAGASAAYRALAPTITPDQMIARALQTVEACSAFGTVAIRSHTNIDPQSGVRGIEAMVALRQRCADRIRIQIVAHVTSDATSMLPETEAWLRSAIDLGVDAIGGVPAFSDQPIAFLKLLFEMAQRSGLPLDMHIDEHLDETTLLFDEVAQMTRAYGMGGRVVAGHCSALSAMPPDAALPSWVTSAPDPLISVTRTRNELSIICPSATVPETILCEAGWKAFTVEGKLELTAVGVLASIVNPLAEAGISILGFSTFDTDYVLVKEADLTRAADTLRRVGHAVTL